MDDKICPQVDDPPSELDVAAAEESDVVVVEEEVSVPTHRAAAAIFASPDVETEAPYIPPSLSSFVAQAKATLKDTQISLKAQLQSPPPKHSNHDVSIDEDSELHSMTEDDDDRRLKRDVLDKFSAAEVNSGIPIATPAKTESGKKLFVDSEEKAPASLTSDVTDIPPSPPASDSMKTFWAQAMKPTPEKELFVSADAVSSDVPETPPSPKASKGSPPFWSQATKQEPEEKLHVSASEAVSPEAPETPPPPKASEGSFWSQAMKPEPEKELHVSPRVAVNSVKPTTPLSPHASTGSQFWGKTKGMPSPKVKGSSSNSSTPTLSNVSMTEEDPVASAPSPRVLKTRVATPAKSPSSLPLSSVKPEAALSPSPLKTPQSMQAAVDSSRTDGATLSLATTLNEVREAAPAAPGQLKSVECPEKETSASEEAVVVVTSSPSVSDESGSMGNVEAKDLPVESPSSVTTSLSSASMDVAAPSATPSKNETHRSPIPSPARSDRASTEIPNPSNVPQDISRQSVDDTDSSAKARQVTSHSPKEKTSGGQKSERSSAGKSTSAPVSSMWDISGSSRVAASPLAPSIESKQEANGVLVEQTHCEQSIDEAAPRADVKEKTEQTTVEEMKTAVPAEDTLVDDLAFLPNQKGSALPVKSNSQPRRTLPKPSAIATSAHPNKGRTSHSKAGTPSIVRPRVASNSTRTTASTRSTSTAASNDRQCTSMSGAPTRLMQGTATSRARTGLSSSRDSRAASSSDDGTAKARERVKHRMQLKKAMEASASKSVAQSVVQKPTLSADDAQARARKRVRQRQLQMKAKQEQIKVEQAQLPNPKDVARPRAKATTSGGVPTYMRGTTSMSARTVPKSPNLQTTSLRGQKTYLSTGRQKQSRDENPITRALGSPTHADHKEPTKTSMPSERPRLTVPKAPRLSTSAKYGVKPPPTARASPNKSQPWQASPRSTQTVTTPAPFHFNESKSSSPVERDVGRRSEPSLAGSVDFMKKGLREETPAASVKRQSKLTMPKPFQFHQSKHSRHSAPAESQQAEPSLAESMDLFMRKGLRDKSSVRKPASREPRLTIPVAPKFAPVAKRFLPKSTAEKEEEMMQQFNSQPFRAQPVPTGATKKRSVRPPTTTPARSLTKPAPFSFRVDRRGASAKRAEGTPDKEVVDLEECKKQFHARPLPRQDYQQPSKRDTVSRSLTTPKPFRFTTSTRGTADTGPSNDEGELSKQFHARPLPKSTYVSPAVPSREPDAHVPSNTSAPTPASAYGGPPVLATSSRTARREASRQVSLKNVELMAKEKKRMAIRKQREKHQEEMIKASIRSPLAQKPTQPFMLRSEARHETYQHHLAEQRQQEEQENRRRMSFHAKPLIKTSPPVKVESERPRTEPRPFHLSSLSRHKMAQRSIRQHVAEEEQERESMSQFKARPIPLSTYQFHPVTPGPKPQLVDPVSPELQLKQRAVERRDFEEYAERERQQEAARKKAVADRLEAEEEEELHEKRNLPVSEGGMIPTANPINAVFLQTGESD